MRQQYQLPCIPVNQFFCFTPTNLTGSLVSMKKYGERVRAARNHARLTQPQLSEKLGGKITQQGISYLEGGDAYGSEFTVQIANICNVDPTWLATGKGEMINRTTPEETKDILEAIKQNPELIRLLKVAAPLTGYQMDVAVQTSIALAKQQDSTPDKNGTQ